MNDRPNYLFDYGIVIVSNLAIIEEATLVSVWFDFSNMIS